MAKSKNKNEQQGSSSSRPSSQSKSVNKGSHQKKDEKTGPSPFTFVLVIIAVLLAYILFLLQSHGVFRDVIPLNDNNCDHIKGIVGSEDMEVHDDYLFVSSDGFRWFHPGAHLESKSEFERIAESKNNGSIILYDLKSNNPQLLSIEREGDSGVDFHPHGLGLYSHKDKTFLFVVNHKRDDDSVDVFLVDKRPSTNELPRKMKFLYSVSAGKVYWNDVTPVNETAFYVSRHTYYKQGEWMNLLENLTMKPWGKVVFCRVDDITGKNPVCRDVVDAASAPNGVTLSYDKKFLFLSEMLARDIVVFKRNMETSDLTPLYRVPLGYLGDNFFIDDTGLYVAGHIKSIQTAHHIQNPRTHRSPSQVSRIRGDFNNRTSVTVETLLVTDGKEFSGASIAVHYGGNIIIGAVADEGFIVCPIHE